MGRLTSMLGPAVVGLAVWCAAGEITVTTAESASARLAVPSSWWVFLVATALAGVVPMWRRDARLALPALLTILPWWPVPLPAIALLWTGPLAWAPIAVALALALPGAPAAVSRFTSRRGAVTAAAATLLACGLTAWSATQQSPQGDEPHYLVTTQSLIKDGDLRVENNFRQRDYAEYYAGRITPDFDRRGKDGEIYSIHPIGVSLVVLPGFALFGYRGAELTLLLFAALTGALMWRIGLAATGDRKAAWFGWAVAALTPSFLLHSFAMFPEGLGAFAFAVAALLFVRLVRADNAVGTASIVIASAAVASFSWLHSRFALLAALFGGLIGVQLMLESARPTAMRVRRTVLFVALPAASAIGWFAFFYALYGTADPRGAHGIIEQSWLRTARGVLGLLFDQQYGFLPFTPALVCIAVAVFGPAAPGVRRLCWIFIGITLVYLAAAVGYRMDEMWWAGLPSAPARYGVAIIPALALPCAVAWKRADRNGRRVWATLLLAGMACALLLVTVERGAIAWNLRDAQARWLEWLAPVVNLPRGWPSYFWPFPSLAPFIAHAALFVAAPAALYALIRVIAKGRAWSDRAWRLACAGWLVVSLSALVQLGWWLNGTNGLDPARSQLHVLGESAAHRLLTIRPLSVSLEADELFRMVIRAEEAKRYEPRPAIARFMRVPPGAYRVRMRLSGSLPPGADWINVAVDGRPVPGFGLSNAVTQFGELRLAAEGNVELSAGGNEEVLRTLVTRVELVPVRIK